MVTVTINGESFAQEHLEPFGVELRPLENRQINVQSWASRDIEQLLAEARRKHVLVIRNAVTSTDQQWREIDASSANGSTRWPHADYGEKPLLMWVLLQGIQRNPTGFVHREPVVQAMFDERQTLQSELMQDQNNPWMHELHEVYTDICQNRHDANVCRPHRLYRRIMWDQNLGNTVRGLEDRFGTSLIEKVFALIMKRKKSKQFSAEDVPAGERCMQAIRNFMEPVLARVKPQTHFHKWRDKPDAAVVVSNDISESDDSTGVLHFGVPNADLQNQGVLGRVSLVDGKFRA